MPITSDICYILLFLALLHLEYPGPVVEDQVLIIASVISAALPPLEPVVDRSAETPLIGPFGYLMRDELLGHPLYDPLGDAAFYRSASAFGCRVKCRRSPI